MKRAVIGGFLSLIGSIWALAIVFIAGNNLVTSWDTKLGRFLSTIIEMDLTLLFAFSVVFIVLGIILMTVELFCKEK
jgi:ABC-type branched-subunit amino acid transport system permease subunit